MEKKIESLHNGKIVVVKPVDTSNIVPLFCKLCNYSMKTIEDSICYRKVGVCSHCDGRWSNDKRVDWTAEKYPQRDWEEWNEYIEIRSISARSPISFR
jgi:hypothetical protein